MASTEENRLKSSQSLWRLSLFYPYLARVIESMQSRVLVDPIYICVECSVVHKNQQAMASHCRIHIHSDGMEKGTVRHIKYNPDHAFSLMCHPSPDKIYQVPVPKYPNPNSSASTSNPLASQMGMIRSSDILQKCVDLGYIQHPTSVNTRSTAFVPAATPVLDLTLRLGPGPTADNSNKQIIESLFAGSGLVTAAKIGGVPK